MDRKNISPKKFFKIGDKIKCVITEIDKEKRRIAISHRLTQENPFSQLIKTHPVGSQIHGLVGNSNDYALYVKLNDYDIDAFLHCNDLSYTGNPEEELKKYKTGDKLIVKILEIKEDQQKYELV